MIIALTRLKDTIPYHRGLKTKRRRIECVQPALKDSEATETDCVAEKPSAAADDDTSLIAR